MPAKAVLVTQGVSKSFGATKALNNVDFACYSGEVHGLVGQNGAGKSTLMCLFAGLFQPTSGRILLDGESVSFRHPAQARMAGIRTVYQVPDLIPHLNVAENLFLGEEPRGKLGLLTHNRLYAQAEELVSRLGLNLPLRQSAASLSVGQQQLVTVARALAPLGEYSRSSARSHGSRRRNDSSPGASKVPSVPVLILDEPTAALGPSEAEYLFGLVKDLRRVGTAVIYISHRLEEVLALADRVSVLRDGQLVATGRAMDTSREQMVRQMTGSTTVNVRSGSERSADKGREVLRATNLEAPGLGPFNLSVRAGEILGIGGVVGSGRTELLRLIFGADRARVGTLHIDGSPVPLDDPRASVRAGVGFVTENRQVDGLAMGLSVQENLSMTRLEELRHEGDLAQRLIAELGIRGKPHQLVSELSGGNQQKVAFGKWLKAGTKLLLIDEPTQGVDVSAKDEIHDQLLALAKSGVAMILVSSDFAELLALSDRILVMKEGRLVEELTGEAMTEDRILGGAVG